MIEWRIRKRGNSLVRFSHSPDVSGASAAAFSRLIVQVLIDLGRLRNDRNGLGEVAKQYATALLRREQEMDFVFLTHPKFKAFAQLAKEIGAAHITGKFSVRNKIVRLFDRQIFPYVYHGTSHDVRHAIYRTHLTIPPQDKKPFILTLHDMHFALDGQKRTPEKVVRLKTSIARADVVCFISEYARKIISEYADLSGKETHIIYNGTDKPQNPRRPQWFKDSMRPFILSIAQIEPHKQFHLLPPMMRHLPEISLIIAGKHAAGMPQLQDAIRRSDVGARTTTPGLITDEEKAYLLQECAGFVFPSAREGFGMPVVEALHYGKPVFCFPHTGLTEVGGEHAFYWQSESAKEMADLVAQHAEADASAASLRGAREQWAAKFSWDTNAAAYVALYKKLAGSMQ